MPTTAKSSTRGGTSANTPWLVIASAIDIPAELSRRFFARVHSGVSGVTPGSRFTPRSRFTERRKFADRTREGGDRKTWVKDLPPDIGSAC